MKKKYPKCKICGLKSIVCEQFPYELCVDCSYVFLKYVYKIPRYIPTDQLEKWYIEKFKRV